jgi:iron complex transport system ATP-binding protein
MILAAHRLAFGYPGRPIGSGVDLEISPGEVCCLLGPNGCGKTTLFKTLMGLLPAQGGEIRLGDRPLAAHGRREIARTIAWVPQAHVPPFPFTVRDVVLMGRTARLGPLAQPGDRDEEVVDSCLDGLGIADLAEADYTRISGGQRQLVLIARALAQEAALMVMDEPTASLDFGNQALLLSEVVRLAGRGLGILLSTHDPDQALAVATRVALMKDGRIVAAGEPADVLTGAGLSAVYDVPVEVERLSSGRAVCVPAVNPRSD